MLSSWEELCIYAYVAAGNSPIEGSNQEHTYIYSMLWCNFLNTCIHFGRVKSLVSQEVFTEHLYEEDQQHSMKIYKNIIPHPDFNGSSKYFEQYLAWELIFFIYCGLFVLILVVFVLFLLSLRFGQISPLAFFRWFTATSDRNDESCNRIPSNYCLP